MNQGPLYNSKVRKSKSRKVLIHQGNGELITKGRNGKIRNKDTIQPKADKPTRQ